MKHLVRFDESIDQSTPCAVYNVEKAELVGIFKTITLASKYVYGTPKENSMSAVIRKKSKIRKYNNKLNLVITARYANQKQIDELGDKNWIIKPGYPMFQQIQVG